MMEEKPYQICKRCVMDTSDPDIVFDERGYCNHCEDYITRISLQTYISGESEKQFEFIVNRIKEKGKNSTYDCIVGISGRVDSCYTAHLCKEHGLRPLLIHMDNGWNTEISVKNVNTMAVYSKVQLVDENSKKINEFLEANTIQSTTGVLEWKKGFVASMGCTIYRNSIVEQVGIFDSRLSTAADQDFHLRVAAIAPIIGLKEVLFFYRVHGNNMHQNIGVMEKDHILVFNKAKKNKLFKSLWFQQKCFSNLYWVLAGSWWKDGQNKLRGFRFIILAILNNPFSIVRIFKTSPS